MSESETNMELWQLKQEIDALRTILTEKDKRIDFLQQSADHWFGEWLHEHKCNDIYQTQLWVAGIKPNTPEREAPKEEKDEH